MHRPNPRSNPDRGSPQTANTLAAKKFPGQRKSATCSGNRSIPALPEQAAIDGEGARSMAKADAVHPSTMLALFRGALRRCPRCGKGRLLHRYLKIVDCCGVCGEPYGHYRTDDAAPWLTILVVGHLTVPLIVICEENFHLPTALALAIYLPVIVGLTLFLLPRCKGVIAAVLWAMKAEGSEKI
jgi:uncharacterized protein (DUF983 family)